MTFPSAWKNRPLRTYGGMAAITLAVGVAASALRPSAAQDGAPAPGLTLIPATISPAASPQTAPIVVAQAPAPPQGAATPAATQAGPQPTPLPRPASTLPATEDRMQLAQLTAEDLHSRLERAFNRALPRLKDDGTPWVRFSVDAGDGAPVLVAAHSQTGEVRLVGRPDQLRAWREIILALDAPAAVGQTTQLVAADRTAAPQIRQTVGFLLAQNQQAAPAQPGDPAVPPAGDEGLIGPVQIEVVDDTGLFVIRGNPRDVARVMQVIRQIEEMSRVSEPRIVVQPLQHVDSQSIAILLQQMFGDADDGFSLAPYYGPLLPLPLGRPNAVLLVGAPNTVGKAAELVKQLDLPGAALTQFEVFRLKNASATQAQTVVEQLFTVEQAEAAAAAPPLGPKALVIAEARTNSLIVRAGPRDMEEVRALINELDRPGGERINELRVFRLKNSLAADLAPVLQRAVRGEAATGDNLAAADRLASLLRLVTIDAEGRQRLESGVLAGVTINADTRANALVVSGPPDSMPLMAALIAQLDVPPDAVAELKVFTIQNGDAVALAEMLRNLFGTTDQQGAGGQGGGPGGTQAAAGARLFQLRISVDERTNSIIAAGSSDELLVVEAVLLRLDASDARQRLNKVYKLKNADAEQVAIALQDWLERKREVEQTAPGVVSPFQQIEREVVVVAEINSNSLIVSATPEYYEEIAAIILQLDEQAPIVMIQVLIGEVRLGDADEFGVELGLQDSLLFDRSLLENIITTSTTTTSQTPGGATTTVQQDTIQAATLAPGFNFGNASQGLGNSGSDRSLATAGNVAAQSIASFGVGRVSPNLGFGGLVLSASSNSVSMLLRALQQSQRLEVLSRPQIMALDNQTGRAFVGQRVPYILESTVDQFGRTNSIDLIDVGLELWVRPRISPDDLVVMEVFAQKSQLGAVADGVPVSIAPDGTAINAPIIDAISAETTISAMSGQTVVLSGLLTKRDEALHRRVPLLADIPLLGDLFRYDATSTIRNELLIVLTPHVIHSRRQSEMIKQVESSRMSWCLADVVDLHGPSGLRSRNDTMGAAEAQTVFPSDVPDENGRFPEKGPGPTLAPPDAGSFAPQAPLPVPPPPPPATAP